MKKSTLIMILSLVLAVALGVGGTLAYLQDTDEDVNVMTLGNVYIEQHEYERVTDENGDPVKGVEGEDFKADYGIEESYKLKEFTQDKPLYPAVYQNGKLVFDEFQQLWNQVGAPGSNDLFDDSVKNVVDKFVFVENTGKSDAYFRTIIAVECPKGMDDLLHLNCTINQRYDWDVETEGVQVSTEAKHIETTIDGERYLIYVAQYQEVLVPGEISRPSLLQVFLDPAAGNAEVEAFGEEAKILVVSQAVQTMGFKDAQTALETAFGVVKADYHPWTDPESMVPSAPTDVVRVEDAEGMMAGLANGADIIADKDLDDQLIYYSDEAIELDAKGATVQLNGSDNIVTDRDDGVPGYAYSYLGFVPSNGEKATISNLNVTGTGFVEIGHHGGSAGIIGGGEYSVNNLEIKNLKSTLVSPNNGNRVSSAFTHYGNAVLNDCVMTGTTALNSSADGYDASFVNKTTTQINGGKYGKIYVFEQAKVTIVDAEVDEIVSYAIKTPSKELGKVVIGSGAKVGTIYVNDIGSYKGNVVIEEGATVDAIVYQGVTYTQAEWLAR